MQPRRSMPVDAAKCLRTRRASRLWLRARFSLVRGRSRRRARRSRTAPGRRRAWRRGPPSPPAGRVFGQLAERLDRPLRAGLGGVLADAAHPVVHRGGQLGHVAVQLRVAHLRHPLRPRLGQLAAPCQSSMRRTRASMTRASCLAPVSDRTAIASRSDLAAVQPGCFGFAQRPPEPGACRVAERSVGVAAGRTGPQRLLEPGGLGPAGQVVPDGPEHPEVVGVGQLAAPAFPSRKELLRRGASLRRGPTRRRVPRHFCLSAAGGRFGAEPGAFARSACASGPVPGRGAILRGCRRRAGSR